MKIASFAVAIGFGTVLALAGCEKVSAPYVMKMDRVDQEMALGNRGYLKGQAPAAEDRKGLVREYIAMDIDLVSVGDKSEAPAIAGETGAVARGPQPAPDEAVVKKETVTKEENIK